MAALPRQRSVVRGFLVAVLVAVLCPGARGQSLPDRPLSWLDGRFTVSGDASASTSRFDSGWFNDLDYGANALRLVALGAAWQARLNDRLTVLGEIRSENTNGPRVLALFARVRPWRHRPVDIQIGRIPPVFGTFGRRRYGTDNPLIGFPLGYQYLTTLRTDVVPANADALLAVRGDGWSFLYPSRVGSATRAPGLPLSSAYVWDTGVQVRVGGPIEVAVAFTNGALAAPRVRDDNGGKQLSARVSGRPMDWLTVGASASTGAYIGSRVRELLADPDREYAQRAYGVDAEVAHDRWLTRAEFMASRFESPMVSQTTAPVTLRAWTVSLESRYKLHPRVYMAGRAERLGFSRIAGSDAVPTPWDAPVSRIEVGGGVYLLHNAVAKLVYQHNWRDVLPVTSTQGRMAAQLAYWF